MLVKYRGVVSSEVSISSSGCSSCGQRTMGTSQLTMTNPFTYYFEGRPYTFYLGQELHVPEELGLALLNKYSFVQGRKLMAFEEVDAN